MATHETGEFVDQENVGAAPDSLYTHEEHGDEHGHTDEYEGNGRLNHMAGSRRDEEETIQCALPQLLSSPTSTTPNDDASQPKKPKFELADQTNLLPVKQVIVIFCGLNCALFCSLLDQTM